MANAYWNRFLEVDLTNGTWKEVPFDDAHARKYIGGVGFGAQILFDQIKVGADPLSPDNIFVATFGPFNGTFFPGQKVTYVFKSPLTDKFGIGRTRSGGNFTVEVKRAGWDSLVFKGKASRPVYLYINDDDVEIRDASFLVGKDTQATHVMIQEELGDPHVRVACIGPAGENMVRFASVQHDTHRSAARSGAGAIMGSKNLKAIAVRGTKVVPLADAEAYHNLIKDMRFRATWASGPWPHQAGFRRFHTCSHSGTNHPLRNFNWSGDVLEAWKVSSEPQERRFYLDYYACPTYCDGNCFSHGVVRYGPYAGAQGENSEWDTSPTILSTGLTDVGGAMAAVSKLDKLGMDGSSCGHTLGWAIECFEKNLLTTADTGGLELGWDKPDLVNQLLVMIAFREGFGDVLAEGSMRAATYLEEQKGLEPGTLLQYACQGRGLENAAVDPRPSYASAVGQATSARGSGDHITDSRGWDDATGACMFMPYRGMSEDDQLSLFRYATGWDYDKEAKTTDFERIVSLQRAFWVREAWPTVPSEVDYNAPKMYVVPIYAGPMKGTVLDRATFEEERAKYYEARGWDARGIPTKATLTNLGLDDVAAGLEQAGVTLA